MFPMINLQCRPTATQWQDTNSGFVIVAGEPLTGSDADAPITGSDADEPFAGSDT